MNTAITIAQFIAGTLTGGAGLVCLGMVAFAIFDPSTDDTADTEPLMHNFLVFVLTMLGGLGLANSWLVSWGPLLGY